MLPTELHLTISTHVESESDFSALARTNEHFYSLLAKDLYRNNIRYRKSAGLVRAAEIGCVKAVKLFVQEGADIHAAAEIRQRAPPNNFLPANALFAAISHGRTKIVKLLLAAGADPNCGTSIRDDCHNPLLLAVMMRKVAIVKLLLAHGAEVFFSQNEYLNGALLSSASATGPLRLVRLLVDHGANIQQRDHTGRTPLQIAMQPLPHPLRSVVKRSAADVDDESAIIEFLLQRGATPLPE